MNAQRTESDGLRRQLEVASQNAVQSNDAASSQIQSVVEAERQHAAMDRHRLLAQIVELINTQAAAQESRLASHAGAMRESLTQSTTALERDVAVYSSGMDAWNEKEDELAAGVKASRDTMKTRITTDWDVSLSVPPSHNWCGPADLPCARLQRATAPRSRTPPSLSMQRRSALSTSR